MEEFKDNIINSILNMFSSGKSNLRFFCQLLITGIIILVVTLLFQNMVDSIFNLSKYWSDEYILGFNRISFCLFSINMIYWILAIILFVKYYFSEEIFIN